MAPILLFLSLIIFTSKANQKDKTFNQSSSFLSLNILSEKVKKIPLVRELKGFEKDLEKNLFKLSDSTFFFKIKKKFKKLLKANKVDLKRIFGENTAYNYSDLKELSSQDVINQSDLIEFEENIFIRYLIKVSERMESPSEEFFNYQEKLIIPHLEIFEILYKADKTLVLNGSFMTHWENYSRMFIRGEFEDKYTKRINFKSFRKIIEWRGAFRKNFSKHFIEYVIIVNKNS